MIQHKTNKTWQLWLAAVTLLIASLFSSFLMVAPVRAAETSSSVLTDLQKDENFKLEDYPAVADDYSLKVIQIAESSAKELLIYVYQPAAETKELRATSINISRELTKEIKYQNYKLEHINSGATLAKYKVLDLTVTDDPVRCYEISGIYRAWDKNIDKDTTNKNEVNETVFNVGKRYTFISSENEVQILCQDIELISITDKYVGFVRYGDTDFLSSATLKDRHFIAFSTDKQIDKLMEVDVYYAYQEKTMFYLDQSNAKKNNPLHKKYGSINTNGYATLKANEPVDVTVQNGFWFGRKNLSYSWDTIQTVDNFIKSVDVDKMYTSGIFDVHTQSKMTEQVREELKDKSWVVSFVDTDYAVKKNLSAGCDVTYTSVGKVSILRLSFDTAGRVYNLGVVDNKQTGSTAPVNKVETTAKSIFEKIWNAIKSAVRWLIVEPYRLAVIIVGLVLLVVLVKIIKAIFGN